MPLLDVNIHFTQITLPLKTDCAMAGNRITLDAATGYLSLGGKDFTYVSADEALSLAAMLIHYFDSKKLNVKNAEI